VYQNQGDVLFLAIWGAIIASVALVMAFARNGPDEVRSKLSEWADFFRLKKAAKWLKDHTIDDRVARYGKWVMMLLLFGGGLGFGYLLAPTPAQPPARIPVSTPIVDKAKIERLADALPKLSNIITSKAIPLYDKVDTIAEEQAQRITIDLTTEDAIKQSASARAESDALSKELTQFLSDNNYDIDDLRMASPDGTGPNNITETLDEHLQALRQLPPNPGASDILKATTLWQAKNLLAFRTGLYAQWIAGCVEGIKQKRAVIEAVLREQH
jgi:hypothetical protein